MNFIHAFHARNSFDKARKNPTVSRGVRLGLASLGTEEMDIANVKGLESLFLAFHVADLHGHTLVCLLGSKNPFNSHSDEKPFLAVLANVGKKSVGERLQFGDSIGAGSSSNLHVRILRWPATFHKIFLHKKR